MTVSESVDELGTAGMTEGPTTNSALAEIERAVSEIGAKVAASRADRGWSLAQLATRADLSTATVHKVERGTMTPSIAVLMKLAAALGRPVAHFIDETDVERDVSVVRAADREPIPTTKHGLTLRNVTGRYGPFQMAGAEATFAADATSGPDPMRHPGEEFVYVLDGGLRFTVADQLHELGPGDAMHYRTYHPHAWRTAGDRPARALWFFGRS
jgi:transcriptional regulator with XRE-family HTH domain